MRADPADLPVRLEISMSEAPEGSRVEMRITDRFWLVGLNTGAEDAFFRYFDSVEPELATKTALVLT